MLGTTYLYPLNIYNMHMLDCVLHCVPYTYELQDVPKKLVKKSKWDGMC